MTQRAAALQPLGTPSTRTRELDHGGALAAAAATAALALIVAGIIASPAAWILAGLAVGVVVLIEPRLGLYGAVFTAGLEYIPFDPVTAPFRFIFLGVGNTTPLGGVAATPVELLVVAATVGWLLRSVSSGSWRWPNRYLMGGMLATSALFLLGVVNGVSNGGDSTIALWEVRGVMVALPLMLIANGLLTERRHLYEFGAVLVASLLFVTGESFWRYMTYIRPGTFDGPVEFAFSHENGVLISVLLVGSLSWALWGTTGKQRLLALGVAIVAAVVLLTLQRRSGLLVAEAGVITIGLVLLVKDWRRFLIVAPIVAILSAIYLGAFWNSGNSLGQPARAFRSVFDTGTVSSRDQASDDYRLRETQNVWWNIQAEPIEGIGFGQEYAKPLPFPDLSNFWPFWPYIPHNTILWVWLKAGVFAFMAFWFLLGTAVSQTASVVRQAKKPWLLVTATVVLAYFPMLAMFSYVDLGLTSPRLMILFGAFLGIVTVLQRFSQQEQAEEAPAEAVA